MTSRISDWQLESDLNSIRNWHFYQSHLCFVLIYFWQTTDEIVSIFFFFKDFLVSITCFVLMHFWQTSDKILSDTATAANDFTQLENLGNLLFLLQNTMSKIFIFWTSCLVNYFIFHPFIFKSCSSSFLIIPDICNFLHNRNLRPRRGGRGNLGKIQKNSSFPREPSLTQCVNFYTVCNSSHCM